MQRSDQAGQQQRQQRLQQPPPPVQGVQGQGVEAAALERAATAPAAMSWAATAAKNGSSTGPRLSRYVMTRHATSLTLTR